MQGQLHGQAHLRVIQVGTSQAGNALHPVDEGIAMNEQCLRRLGEVAVMLEVDLQSVDLFSGEIG